jgi:hypothetical protein
MPSPAPSTLVGFSTRGTRSGGWRELQTCDHKSHQLVLILISPFWIASSLCALYCGVKQHSRDEQLSIIAAPGTVWDAQQICNVIRHWSDKLSSFVDNRQTFMALLYFVH